jgi:hypothetical protein
MDGGAFIFIFLTHKQKYFAELFYIYPFHVLIRGANNDN